MSKKTVAKKTSPRAPRLKDFGARLKHWREKRGLSGSELGKMVGMTRQAISRLEVGGTNPTLVVISKLCDALEVKFETFFKGFK